MLRVFREQESLRCHGLGPGVTSQSFLPYQQAFPLGINALFRQKHATVNYSWGSSKVHKGSRCSSAVTARLEVFQVRYQDYPFLSCWSPLNIRSQPWRTNSDWGKYCVWLWSCGHGCLEPSSLNLFLHSRFFLRTRNYLCSHFHQLRMFCGKYETLLYSSEARCYPISRMRR